VKLAELLKFLGKEDVGKISMKPSMKIQEMENLAMDFKFMEKQGMHFENLGPGGM
tara:strand:+ start:2935 stop:3099 length:165 start_codon:yes stop_codon:yes gene_type:complete